MKTTNEVTMKGIFNPRTGLNNPYRRGNFLKNFATVLCGPFQPRNREQRDLPPSEGSSTAQQTETTTPATAQDSQLLLSTSIEQDEPQSTTATDTKQLLSSSSSQNERLYS